MTKQKGTMKKIKLKEVSRQFVIDVFINARGADDAMEKFDQCEFGKRANWKIMVELTQQPSDGPNG